MIASPMGVARQLHGAVLSMTGLAGTCRHSAPPGTKEHNLFRPFRYPGRYPRAEIDLGGARAPQSKLLCSWNRLERATRIERATLTLASGAFFVPGRPICNAFILQVIVPKSQLVPGGPGASHWNPDEFAPPTGVGVAERLGRCTANGEFGSRFARRAAPKTSLATSLCPS